MSYTYSQARARLVTAALTYGRAWIRSRLADLGAASAADEQKTDRALAHRLAWALLPAASDVMSSEKPLFDTKAVLGGTDSRTVANEL